MKNALYIMAVLLAMTVAAEAEDGSRLWLPASLNSQHSTLNSQTIAMQELQAAWQGDPVVLKRKKGMAQDAYTIVSVNGKATITASTDVALLYGAYHLLRLQQMGAVTPNMNVSEEPIYSLRLLNHWDNPDGTVERGFAGRSIFFPDYDPQHILHYARANASVGINGTVLNNVNAKPEALSTENLVKTAAIADILRPYGIKVYLSVNFASPIKLGNLATADPLDDNVVKWWRDKAGEIYRLIPDFGGFLVKANSEGEPGPCDYGRSHAEGANMIADALKRHGGIVIWRAFVYNPQSSDRANQAYEEFMPLDGQFHDNVIIQIKNGPIDFQPREPYSPLFTGLKHTPMMAEFQVTQEYLGGSNHLVFLAPMWKEFFSTLNPNLSTLNSQPSTLNSQPSPFTLHPSPLKGIAGVANIGNDTNWCGHHFAQANWYAFGRLAWNPSLTTEEIADEWICQTFGHTGVNQPLSSSFLSSVRDMMLQSHEAAVDYMMPLGLHHIFAGEHHYGPAPWYTKPGMRADWTPPYYHRADSIGVGFDRTAVGSNNVAQYPDSLRRLYGDISTCPENLIAWFHHVPWNHRMNSGRTFWDELCHRYDRGVRKARAFLATWDALEPYVDSQRFREVQRRLRIQARDAEWWRDACLLYFQTFSHRPIPQDMEHPVHNLDQMMQFELGITKYENPADGCYRP